MILIVVESPTKARTIQGFLDKSYKTVSSKGHVVDLPPSSLGIDIENNFTPEYIILKKEIAQELQSASAKAELVLLAMDPDREGEAIAYHIQSLIKTPSKRILIYEITREAVRKAIQNPTSLDTAKVEAQQARRILDRLVGYEVSPLLWKIFHKRDLSAGRVQSVALRLICEREVEIRDFKPSEFWDIKCNLKPRLTEGRNEEAFWAKLIQPKITNLQEAQKAETQLKIAKFKVKDFKKQKKQRSPYPPYITSTLQQDASARLKFSTKMTMRIAQELFEGIELGKKKNVGLITYMRTDSLRVADKATFAARAHIKENIGKQYLSPKIRKYVKGKKLGAHEAIRPTSVKRTPESIKESLTPQQLKLYTLIWQRFLASQMTNAIYEQRTAGIEANGYLLKGESNTLEFDGFSKVYKIERKEEKPIPELEITTELTLLDLQKEQKFTKPKPRYTEGTMVRELESKGIGRPSTYAPIISRIIEKEYVKKDQRKLFPTELGETVNKVLTSRFQNIFNVDFTRQMEERLDKIEVEELERITVLKDFYKPFKDDVVKSFEETKEIRKEITEKTEEKCEICGKPMVIKWGKHGKFLACSGFPECKHTKPLEPQKIEQKCPKCGAPLVIKESKYGRFLACSNYPECKFTKMMEIGIKCPEPECGGEIIERQTKKKKIFYGCANYPKCKFALWDKPVAQKCSSCGYPILVEKRDQRQCPKCKKKIPRSQDETKK